MGHVQLTTSIRPLSSIASRTGLRWSTTSNNQAHCKKGPSRYASNMLLEILRCFTHGVPPVSEGTPTHSGGTRMPLLLLPVSPEEEEAERLYYAAISTSLPKRAFTILAKDLSRRSPEAASYLTGLILYRGQLWPVVGGTIVNA
jgi:hypothetical protein